MGPPAVTATVILDSVDAPSVDNAAGAEPIVVSDADSGEVTDSEDEQFLREEQERFLYDMFDESDNTGSELNSDDDELPGGYVRGTGGYFGGYGRCFKCGEQLHILSVLHTLKFSSRHVRTHHWESKRCMLVSEVCCYLELCVGRVCMICTEM